MTDRPTFPPTTSPPPAGADPLLARYHRATALAQQPGRPDPAVRERILAQARLHPQADTPPTVAPPRPVANEGRWKLRALASVMVMGLAGLLAWQADQAPDTPPMVPVPAPAPVAQEAAPEGVAAQAGAKAAPPARLQQAPAARFAAPAPTLWQAAARGEPEAVRQALAAGVPADARDAQGRTALMQAVTEGDGSERYVAVVQALLAAGADPRLPDADGRTAIDHARARGQGRLLDLLNAAPPR